MNSSHEQQEAPNSTLLHLKNTSNQNKHLLLIHLALGS